MVGTLRMKLLLENGCSETCSPVYTEFGSRYKVATVAKYLLSMLFLFLSPKASMLFVLVLMRYGTIVCMTAPVHRKVILQVA